MVRKKTVLLEHYILQNKGNAENSKAEEGSLFLLLSCISGAGNLFSGSYSLLILLNNISFWEASIKQITPTSYFKSSISDGLRFII